MPLKLSGKHGISIYHNNSYGTRYARAHETTTHAPICRSKCSRYLSIVIMNDKLGHNDLTHKTWNLFDLITNFLVFHRSLRPNNENENSIVGKNVIINWYLVRNLSSFRSIFFNQSYTMANIAAFLRTYFKKGLY